MLFDQTQACASATSCVLHRMLNLAIAPLAHNTARLTRKLFECVSVSKRVKVSAVKLGGLIDPQHSPQASANKLSVLSGANLKQPDWSFCVF